MAPLGIGFARLGHRTASLLLILGLVWLQAGPAAALPVTQTIVARTGQQAPGAPAGAVFNDFGSPVLNAAGEVAFLGFLAPGSGGVTVRAGLWGPSPAGTTLIAPIGGAPPDGPAGAVLSGISGAVLDDAGHTPFVGTLAVGPGGVTSSTDQALFAPDASGALKIVAREGEPAPGATGAVFNSFTPAGEDPAVVGLRADLRIGTGGVTNANNQGVWAVDDTGAYRLMAREGQQAPGTPNGAVFTEFRPRVDDNAGGGVAFRGFLLSGAGGVTSMNDDGIWGPDGAGGVTLVARKGSAAPGAPPTEVFAGFFDPVVNDAGQVAFQSFTIPAPMSPISFSGIWGPDQNGALMLLARQGAQAPGADPGAVFRRFATSNIEAPFLSESGGVAFRGELLVGMGGVTSSDDTGLWGPDGAGGVTLRVREGDLIPDLLGVSFAEFDSDPVLNRRGDMVFFGNLQGAGVTPSNSGGLFFQSADGQLELIARRGDSIEIAPGIFRTIGFISINLGPVGGGLDVFNDRRDIIFSAIFTDQSEALILARVPEPTFARAAALLVAALALIRGFGAQKP